MNKFLLIICEGTSDKITLYLPTKSFIKKKEISIRPEVTHSDITLREDATKDSCKKIIEDIIKNYKKQYNLFTSDFFAVAHIIDTDGAFISNDIYVESNKGYFIDETNGIIYTNDIDKSKDINFKKKEIYEYLLSQEKICSVDYKLFFFSRNLEHDLYNKPNCTEQEKINLSNAFENRYEEKPNDFYNRINDVSFNVPHKYKESWNYILSDSNSIYRGNNYIILLDLISSYKKNK